MNRTKIEYLDYTWNPFVGCTGKDCAVGSNCWARRMAKRMKPKCAKCYEFTPHYHYERFTQPEKMKNPSVIGVGFMGDIFDSGYGIAIHKSLFYEMGKCFRHRFLVLTKQSETMVSFFKNWENVPKNVAVGVSVNNSKDLHRIDDLRQVDAIMRYVSFEPLYEELEPSFDGISWIIIGGQTNPKLMPDPEWVFRLIEKAHMDKIPVFVKNNVPGVELHEYPSFLDIKK